MVQYILGVISVILLICVLVLMGLQCYYIVALIIENEIGRVRGIPLLLLTVLLGYFLVPGLFFPDELAIPPWLRVLLLASPLIMLKCSSRLIDFYWDTRDRRQSARDIRICLGILEGDPGNGPVNIRLGDLFNRLGDEDKARDFYQKALGLMPGHAGVVRKLYMLDNRIILRPEKPSAADLLEAAKIETRKTLKVCLVIALAIFLLWLFW